MGVCGVVLLYLAVNFACVRALGVEGLAATTTPATAVMRLAFGEAGARLIAVGITISTLGFLSQGMLTAPRVYFAMARDGLFFGAVARLSERTRVPVVAVALQGALAAVIALSGTYEQILNYVVSADFIFFGLTAAALFVLRRRAARESAGRPGADATGDAQASDARGFRVPWHPLTTALFVAACALIVAATVYKHPSDSAAGLLIVLAGVPAYLFWRRRKAR